MIVLNEIDRSRPSIELKANRIVLLSLKCKVYFEKAKSNKINWVYKKNHMTPHKELV